MDNGSHIYTFKVRTPDGGNLPLSKYAGKVLLIVNTASKCGFTPQYEGLQRLYEKHKDEGFAILAFPCNQFGGQEPGSAEEIREFCEQHYNISFPVFDKIKVNGPEAEPLFSFLKEKAKGLFGMKRIQWNFTKFLVSSQGKVIKRFAPSKTPERIASFIEKELRR